MLGGGYWSTAMQNCWMFISWHCIAVMVVARVLIDSCVAVYPAPKFTINSLYNVINA
jgi:hypothetical protein